MLPVAAAHWGLVSVSARAEDVANTARIHQFLQAKLEPFIATVFRAVFWVTSAKNADKIYS